MMEELEQSGRFGKFDEIENIDPIYICGLARSGTTILLRYLDSTLTMASPSYRDMPFPTTPLAWRHFSRPRQLALEPLERGHGDGITIDADSPEAFEEIIWKQYYPEHYSNDQINLWETLDEKPEATAALRSWGRKVILARKYDNPLANRLLIKNNAGIARLSLITKIYPNAKILVPFRHPVAHVASLIKRHIRSDSSQEISRFNKRYMDDLGHYEFGKGMKIINYPGMKMWNVSQAESTDFWFAYWMACYGFLLDNPHDQVMFFDHDAASAAPDKMADRLAAFLGIARTNLNDPNEFYQNRPHDSFGLPKEAGELWERLRQSPKNLIHQTSGAI
ncbi:sulfotransferase [Parasphingorhabdus halotolerans]|uniref:Sulfotransferase n=1 Tax=Parasphingorhabdus halotolerans TaxID=2725558 RepID=A0A6H2DP48_9SPHN|nr:sulfotransferase [Parasphingorhabdus halotolerans]QJB69735.1 sulfotransferase [Parasphingorhabdus halotolerans]